MLHLFHGLLLHANGPTEPPLDSCTDAATAQAARLVEQDPTRRMPEVRASHLRAVSAFDAIMERVTQQPDLIVIGTHGRNGPGRLLMGSTGEKVLRHAPGNVVTVKSAVRPRDAGDPHRGSGASGLLGGVGTGARRGPVALGDH